MADWEASINQVQELSTNVCLHAQGEWRRKPDNIPFPVGITAPPHCVADILYSIFMPAIRQGLIEVGRRLVKYIPVG